MRGQLRRSAAACSRYWPTPPCVPRACTWRRGRPSAASLPGLGPIRRPPLEYGGAETGGPTSRRPETERWGCRVRPQPPSRWPGVLRTRMVNQLHLSIPPMCRRPRTRQNGRRSRCTHRIPVKQQGESKAVRCSKVYETGMLDNKPSNTSLDCSLPTCAG